MSKQKHKASVTNALFHVASDWPGQSEKAVSLRPGDTHESELEAKGEVFGVTEGGRVMP